MIQLTFLKGIKHGYNASKTFERRGNQIHKVSDYDIGMTFFHNVESVPLSHPHLAAKLANRADVGWFQIQGQPVADLPQKVRRLKENFPPVLTRLLVMDIDKYTLPPDIAAEWVSADNATTVRIIRKALERLGLPVLAQAAFTYCLSSSQLNRTTLSVHLYFILDTEIDLADLRRWARVMNKGYGVNVIDSAIYKSVQPIYISAPICANFTDPFPKRIHYDTGGNPEVSVIELKRLGFIMNKQPAPTNINRAFDTYSKQVEKSDKAIKKSWVRTLEAYCGTPGRGINEPSHRAAAQMVKEEGSDNIRADLDGYTKSFYDEMWRAIKHHGVRGNQSDIDIYTEDKARNYVESALDKGFGDEADKLIERAKDIIAQAVIDNSAGPLLRNESKRVFQKIQKDHNAKWWDIENEIKSKCRKLIPIGDFRKQIKVYQMNPSGLPFDPTDEEAVLKHMLTQITLLQDTLGEKYLHWTDKDNPLGYVVVPISSPRTAGHIRNLYRKITKSNPPLKVLDWATSSVLDQENELNKSTRALVGNRSFRHEDTIYYRVGDVNGTDITVVVQPDKVQYRKTNEIPGIYWQTKQFSPMRIPGKDALTKKFGTDDPTFDQVKKYLSVALPKFIHCESECVGSLTSLAVSILARKPLIYMGVFEGPASSGKTFGASVFKQLFDPKGEDTEYGTSTVNALPKKLDRNDYSIFMEGEVTIFDNIIRLTEEHQATFAQTSTGSQMLRRIMWSQINEHIKMQQCVILTCVNNPIDQVDLAARSLKITFDKTQIGKNTRQLEKQFLDEAPIIRYCWFRAAAEYLKVNLSTPADPNVNIRDRMGSIIDALLGNREPTRTLVEDIQKAAYNKKLNDTVDNPVVLMFIAFLDSHTQNVIKWTSADRWREFREWVRQNGGSEKTVQFEDNGNHEATVYINLEELPTGQRSFDTIMGTAKTNIDMVSQWSVSRPRKNNVRLTGYTNKLGDLRHIM